MEGTGDAMSLQSCGYFFLLSAPGRQSRCYESSFKVTWRMPPLLHN